jgi:putative flippase GtrA
MSHSGLQAAETRGALAHQIPAFLAIGALGFCLDAGLTVAFVRWFGVSPLLARLPAFALVTLVNFALNRAFTFRSTGTPWLAALGRYILVCLAGTAVNYAVYAICLAVAASAGVVISPALLTLFVACGTGAAALITFVGFRSFAFRS